MLPKLSILVKAAAAVLMITALLFLTTANFWAYGFKSQHVSAAAAPSDEEQDAGASVPNPVEEKNANTLQNLSEYLHDHHCSLMHYPIAVISFGNRHDITNLPIHHPELLTPPPKQVG